MNKILISLACFAFLVSLSGSVWAVTNVTGCGTLNNAGESYVLSSDISTSGTCITIGADNITLDGAGYSITGSGSAMGVYLNGRSGVTVKNLNVSGLGNGIYLYYSNNNTLTNNTASSNNGYGISLGYSSSNILTGNTAKENNYYDVYVWTYSDLECNNVIQNNTGSGDRPIKYFNSSMSLQNEILSELILCNADNSKINNVTIEGSATKQNNGLLVIRTDNSNFTNINSSSNWGGIYLLSASYNTLTNNTVSNNDNGISLDHSSSNILTGNTANSNNDYGIQLYYSSSSNTITNNVIDDSATGGFYFSDANSYYNTIKDNTINGDTYYHLVNEDGIVLENLVLTAEKSSNLGRVSVINSTNVTLRNLTLANNTVSGASGLYLYQTANSNITDVTSYSSFNGILLKSSSSNNTLRDNNASSNNQYGIYLDPSSNSNTITNNTASNNDYGIYLESSSNTLTNNTASNNWQGIYIDSSSSNTLTNNNASNNNVGIYFDWYSRYNTLTNNTASNNDYGIVLFSSRSNTLTGNTAKENEGYDVGFHATSDMDCNNVVENNTGSGDRPIKYFNSSVSLQDEVLSELILCNADNSNIDNVTIEGSVTKKNNRFFVIRTDYSNFTNINSSNNDYGIYLWSAGYNTLTNNTASNNTHHGISLASSSSSNILTKNTANSNRYGISLSSSSNNTLTNNTANSNSQDGIQLYKSSNNTLTGNTANSNNRGIYLISSSSNAIYNNHFNNTANFNIGGTIYDNDWNTTKTPGTNIIGGPYLGGNFWAKPDGTGFSETCTDSDGDGICDLSYTLASGNVDYLPLTPIFVPPTTTTTMTTTSTTTTSTTTTTTTTTSTTTTTTTSTTTTTLPTQTTVAVDNATAPPMGDTTVSMTIENVLDIGVADITLAYDRSVVQVLNVITGDFDFMDAAIDNANGITRTGAMQMVNPGLNGSVTLANITLKAVGSIGQCSALNLSINELKVVGPPEADIPATVVNGMFCIEETTPPAVTNPSAHPQSIPEDTDNDPTCTGTPYSEVSQLNVTVIDDSGVLSVATDLSAIGGLHDQPMGNVSDTWTVATSASIGSAIYNGTDYLPHYLRVNATDIYNNSNSSMSIPLTVIKNGDVNEDGNTTLYDAMYLARNVLGKPGFETITPGVADVSGDCSKGIYDAMHLAKNVLGKPGFETLR